MASVPHSALDSLHSWHSREQHPVWFKCFSEREQEHLVKDDLTASTCVTAVLVSVVTVGFLLISGSVLLTLL